MTAIKRRSILNTDKEMCISLSVGSPNFVLKSKSLFDVELQCSSALLQCQLVNAVHSKGSLCSPQMAVPKKAQCRGYEQVYDVPSNLAGSPPRHHNLGERGLYRTNFRVRFIQTVRGASFMRDQDRGFIPSLRPWYTGPGG
jgi:hypothetical protein